MSQNLLSAVVVIGALRVELLFLMVLWVGLRCVSVVLTSHIHLFCYHLPSASHYGGLHATFSVRKTHYGRNIST